ncbi:CC0125/CC1285 family lipoprotein [Hyphomicrobium sp.]|uniref:CC0125/CC1285 family lipoprotein n=1 Tax=Hyphomicrobium sp. TaxID=82 RepID=UPI002E31FB60|nr:hypothetical protein [Hyphomicrobium sp.]HEX2842400.1 hypothetical protein [Hyphomicrobium sp.]
MFRPLANCAALASAAIFMAGCSTGVGGIGATGALPYQHSNAIISAGYSESIIGPDRYRIEVKGPVATPRERMEKIAATRAAEIGSENKLKFFKIESMAHNTICKSYVAGGQPGSGAGPTKKTQQLAVLTADVSYAAAPVDASYAESKTAFDQYRAELDLPSATPAAAAPVSSAPCG